MHGEKILELLKSKNAKPCPFCGGTEIVLERYDDGIGDRWCIWCTHCMAGIDPGWAQNKFDVEQMWNRRV